ncbi:MAG: hypothetical protein BJ554DRAFT_8145, partial [Olpidium bornovanus]
PCSLNLFTRENVIALFKIFDVTEKGYITLEQYLEGKAHKNFDLPAHTPARKKKKKSHVVRKK